MLPVGSEDALLNDVVETIEKDELKSRIENVPMTTYFFAQFTLLSGVMQIMYGL